MSKILRWALLSTANINKALIGLLRQSARSELAAVASRDAVLAACAYADEHGIPQAFGSYEALLADPDIDAVYLSLPNGLHAQWRLKRCRPATRAVREAVVSMAEFAQVEAVYANGVTIFEAFTYLHHPQTRRAIQFGAQRR